MRNGIKQSWCVCSFVGLLAVSAMGETTLRFAVVEINGIDVAGAPSTSVEALPGDIITMEILVRDWSPEGQGLRGYEMKVDFCSLTSGSAGNIYYKDLATTTDENGYCTGGQCAGGGCTADGDVACGAMTPLPANNANAFIDQSNCFNDDDPIGSDVGFWSDGGCDGPLGCIATDCSEGADGIIQWIHGFGAGLGDANLAINTRTLCGYRFISGLGSASNSPISAQDGKWFYLGTTIHEVSADAAGTFTLCLSSDDNDHDGEADWSFMRDADGSAAIVPVAFECSTISIPGGPDPQLISSFPPDGSIDARQPTLDGSSTGWDSIDLTFDADVSGLVAGDLSVTVTGGGAAPGIAGVSAVGGAATVTLDMHIPVGQWTTFTHIASGTSVRLGYLPADSNGDGTSTPSDILEVIDALNGAVALDIWQSDVNRSNLAEPSDILTVIDLLNGAGDFDQWLNVSLP